MDAYSGDHQTGHQIMTIAERTAHRKKSLENLESRIIQILTDHGPDPISRDQIEEYLSNRHVDTNAFERHSTFDVRDAISALLRSKKIEEHFARSIKLAAH